MFVLIYVSGPKKKKIAIDNLRNLPKLSEIDFPNAGFKIIECNSRQIDIA
jgi:hypothetical protein